MYFRFSATRKYPFTESFLKLYISNVVSLRDFSFICKGWTNCKNSLELSSSTCLFITLLRWITRFLISVGNLRFGSSLESMRRCRLHRTRCTLNFFKKEFHHCCLQYSKKTYIQSKILKVVFKYILNRYYCCVMSFRLLTWTQYNHKLWLNINNHD